MQDALYKALYPKASEHDVLANRDRIIIDRTGPSGAPIMYLVTREIGLGPTAPLVEAAANVIRCFAPPGAFQPEVRVVGPEQAGTIGIPVDVIDLATD